MARDLLDQLSIFTFKEAAVDERPAARALFHEVYTHDIGHVPEDGLDDLAHHLIAKSTSGEVVASFRLLGPQLRPFDIERFCDLTHHIARDAKPALLGRLSIRHDMRSVQQSTLLQVGMLKLAVLFAQQHSLSDLFLYAMPHLITFYRGGFFTPLDCYFFYAPLAVSMQIMQLNIRDLQDRYLKSRSTRLAFLLGSQPPNFVL